MAPTSLECLPAEILERIASSGPAESVFALTKTCHTLHRACHVTVVFKAIIESHRPLWEDSNMIDVPTLSRYIGSDDTLASARFALADQRAFELRRYLSMELERVGQSVDDHYYRKNCENWLPHLLIAKYPITQMRCWLWLRFYSPHPSEFKMSLKGQFCFTAAMMSIPENEIYQGPAAWPRQELNIRKHGSLIESLSAIAAFAIILGKYILLRRTGRRTYAGLVDMPFPDPPSANNIPMLPIDSTYELPLPFHSMHTDPYTVEDPWTKWLHRHVAKMLESEFLVTGQWCGYYNYDGADAFDNPMMDIQFTNVPSPRLADATTQRVHAQGQDGAGQFTLRGVVHANGRFDLQKVYIGHSLDWECFMTPFGIFGSWSYRNARAGTLWLWKKEWSDQ